MAETLEIHAGETATPERCLKGGGIQTEIIENVDDGGHVRRQRVRIECVIDSYWHMRRIDDCQRAAALKFREIYLRVNCAYNARVLSDLVLVDGTRPAPDSKMAAHLDCTQSLNKACENISRIQLQVIKDVCGYNKRAGGKDKLKILKRGLDKLVSYWGISR